MRLGSPRSTVKRGKWVVRLSAHDPVIGRRPVKQLGTFATKRVAEDHVRALTAGRVGTAGETLAEFLEKVWLPAKEGRVEVATFDQYSWAVRRHIVPLLGAVRLRDLTAEVVDAWIGELRAETEAGRPRLGATSARLVRKVLSMGLEEAVQRGRMPSNPVALTQPPRPDRSRKKLGWTLDEARQFLRVAAEHRLFAAFHLGLVTGLRRGEVLALRWSDVDLERHQLELAQQLSLERGRPVLKVSPRSSGSVSTA